MSCRGVRKSILEYVDGTLPAGEQGAVRLHLESCASCAGIAGRLELSGRALASMEPPTMDEAASERVLASVMGRRDASPAKSFGTWLRSRQALTVGAAVAAVVVALSIFVAVGFNGGKQAGPGELEERAASGTASDATEPGAEQAPAASAQKEAYMLDGAVEPGPPPLPVVTTSTTDYTPDSLRAMVEALPVRKEYAESYTMGDAAVLGSTFAKKAADEAAGHGMDGAELEAMISYITASEPVLLTCYVEEAAFGGRGAWIIGFAAPPRTGEGVNLSRTEVWVMDPARFPDNPDGSIIYLPRIQVVGSGLLILRFLRGVRSEILRY